MAKRYGCTVCGYVYDEAKGIPEAGIAPGTQWEDLPTGWVCPVCGAPKDDFDEEDGLEKESSPAPEKEKSHPEDEADDLRELSFMEISAICSNLERSCEKQYKPEEALRFKALAKHYRERAGAAESADVNQILTLAEEDLDSGFPAANHAAEGDRGAGRALVWTEKVTRIAKSLLQRYEEQGEAMLEGTHVYLCTICGFIYIGDEPPPLCPVCKVPQWKFEKMEGR